MKRLFLLSTLILASTTFFAFAAETPRSNQKKSRVVLEIIDTADFNKKEISKEVETNLVKLVQEGLKRETVLKEMIEQQKIDNLKLKLELKKAHRMIEGQQQTIELLKKQLNKNAS